MLCERVNITFVCMCELVLISQFHGLFINTFPLRCLQQCGWMGEGLLECVFVWTFSTVCGCLFEDPCVSAI